MLEQWRSQPLSATVYVLTVTDDGVYVYYMGYILLQNASRFVVKSIYDFMTFKAGSNASKKHGV